MPGRRRQPESPGQAVHWGNCRKESSFTVSVLDIYTTRKKLDFHCIYWKNVWHWWKSSKHLVVNLWLQMGIQTFREGQICFWNLKLHHHAFSWSSVSRRTLGFVQLTSLSRSLRCHLQSEHWRASWVTFQSEDALQQKGGKCTLRFDSGTFDKSFVRHCVVHRR